MSAAPPLTSNDGVIEKTSGVEKIAHITGELSNHAFCPNMVCYGLHSFVSVTHAMKASKHASEEGQKAFASSPLNTLDDGIEFLKENSGKKGASLNARAQAWRASGQVGFVAKEASKNFFGMFPLLRGSTMYRRTTEEEVEIMHFLLRSKFERDHALRKVLRDTEDAYLLHYSWSRPEAHDSAWSGYSKKDKDGTFTVYGSNLIGKTLMRVREELCARELLMDRP